MTLQSSQHMLEDIITNRYIKILVISICVFIISSLTIYCQINTSEYHSVYVDRAIITDSAITDVLKNTIIPILKSNDFNAKHGMIQIWDQTRAEDRNCVCCDSLIISIEIELNGKIAAYIYSINKTTHSNVSLTRIDGFDIYIISNAPKKWFQTSGKPLYMGKICLKDRLFLTDDAAGLTFFYKGVDGCFELYRVETVRCSWLDNIKMQKLKIPTNGKTSQ